MQKIPVHTHEDEIISYYTKLNLDHTSPSQESMLDSDWLIKYCFFTQEERRLMNINYRMTAGVTVGRASQRYISKYMYDADKKILNEKKDLDQIIKDEIQEYEKYQPHNELDAEQHQETKQYLADMIKMTVAAIKDLKLDDESASERYCHQYFKGLVLPKIGRIDYEDRKSIIELKTKHRSKRKTNTKQGFSWVKGYIPKEPDANHVKQVAFYSHSTGKTPHLLYVNQDSFQVFTPDNCEMLKPDYLKFCVTEDYKKAKVRQNIVQLAKGNVQDMARLIPPPDFSSYTWKDIQMEYITKAATLWDKV